MVQRGEPESADGSGAGAFSKAMIRVKVWEP